MPDLRNSKIPDIVAELTQYGIDAMVHDPLGDPREAHEEYKIEITPLEKLTGLDAIILAVAHNEYINELRRHLRARARRRRRDRREERRSRRSRRAASGSGAL